MSFLRRIVPAADQHARPAVPAAASKPSRLAALFLGAGDPRMEVDPFERLALRARAEREREAARAAAGMTRARRPLMAG